MKVLVLVVVVSAACGSQRTASPASPSCDVVVTRSADGRSGAAACEHSPVPTVLGTQAPVPPERGKEDGKGKGKGRD